MEDSLTDSSEERHFDRYMYLDGSSEDSDGRRSPENEFVQNLADRENRVLHDQDDVENSLKDSAGDSSDDGFFGKASSEEEDVEDIA